MTEKRPRQYAFEIAALRTKQERIEALNAVPEKYRALVKRHVEIIYRINRYGKTQKKRS